MPLCGGTGAAKPADAEVQAICDAWSRYRSRLPEPDIGGKDMRHEMEFRVRGAIESKLNRKFDAFVALSVASQIVAGVNYFVKIHLGNDDYVHVRIYKHFSDGPVVHGVQYPKTKDDPVIYFAQE